MTQQGYLVPGDTTLSCKTPPPSITLNTKDAGEIAKFTENGFYYKGEFIEDAGEVHRLLKEVLGIMKAEQTSLREQALAALNVIEDKMLGPTNEEKLIRRALEQLPD